MPSRRAAGFRLKKPSASTGDMPPGPAAAVTADQSVRVDWVGGGDTPPVAAPTKAAPAKAAPTKAARSALATPAARLVCDAASEVIIKLMCLAAMQLLGLVGSVPKWTGVWIVLEAGDGSATAPFFGKIINCAGDSTAATDKTGFCKDWWAFRGGKAGRQRRQQAEAASDKAGGRGESEEHGGGQGDAGRDDRDEDGLHGDCGKGSNGDGGKGSSGEGGKSSDRDGRKDSSGDISCSGLAAYPSTSLHDRMTVNAVVRSGLGRKELSDADMNKVLFIGGLDTVNDITTADVANLFSRAGGILRQRCSEAGGFSWARSCPLELLANEWTSSAIKRRVNGVHFLPLKNPASKGHTMNDKRLAWCVAVHLSPFYGKVFEMVMAGVRRSGQKRRLRAKDPFGDASQLTVKSKKPRGSRQATKKQSGKTKSKALALTKAEIIAATAKERVEEAENKAAVTEAEAKYALPKTAAAEAAASKAAAAADAARVSKASAKVAPPPGAPLPGAAGVGAGGVAAAGGGGDGPIPIVAPEPLWALERASSTARMHQVWMRRPAPVLPPSAVVSVVHLSGSALSTATRACTRVRVILPRALLKDAFGALAAAERAANPPAVNDSNEMQLVVKLTLAKYDPVYLFESTLMEMSSALAFNEAIGSSIRFNSWTSRLALSNAQLPGMLNLWSGSSMEISSMAEAVHGDIALRLPGDCVWALPRGGLRSSSTEVQVGAFGGYSVSVPDVCGAGQEAFITNALLDAGLAELQDRCTSSSIPAGVLSTSQSASFTHIAKKQVPLERAMTAILEVLDSWSSSVTQFVMLLNVENVHWISATLSFLSGSVTVYDSLGGGRCAAKDHILNRLVLFARQAELRWRVSHPDLSVGGIEWTVHKVNSPRQGDSYNCGLFAFTYIWCTIYRQDWTSVVVVGDQLRLSLIYFVLMCGRAREGNRAAA